MQKSQGYREIFVGIFVLGAFLLLLTVVLFFGRSQNILKAQFEINGIFRSVAGLSPGADVLLAGVKVGSVKDITFSGYRGVRVDMDIDLDKQDKIRRDSVATIRTKGLMGDTYVAITIGSPGEPAVSRGGTITTTEPFELSQLLEEMRPTLGELRGLFHRSSLLVSKLGDSQTLLNELLENMNAITTDLRQGRGTAGALLTDDTLYRKAVTLAETANETMDSVKDTSKSIQRSTEHFPEVIGQGTATLESIKRAADKTTDTMKDASELIFKLQDVVEEARPVVSHIRASSENVEQITARIGPLIQSATEGVDEARAVIRALSQSWLLKGYMPPLPPVEPIGVTGRDRAASEEDMP